jgi:hypothetical protein
MAAGMQLAVLEPSPAEGVGYGVQGTARTYACPPQPPPPPAVCVFRMPSMCVDPHRACGCAQECMARCLVVGVWCGCGPWPMWCVYCVNGPRHHDSRERPPTLSLGPSSLSPLRVRWVSCKRIATPSTRRADGGSRPAPPARRTPTRERRRGLARG